MKVGTICKLKVACLGNKAGTLGVVFYDYGDGFQAIFENGHYDGFSRTSILEGPNVEEAEYCLEEVGFEESLAGYQFKNVLKVIADYRMGLFNITWSERWKRKAAFRVEAPEQPPNINPAETISEYPESMPPEFEKCEVYADGNKPPFLRFKRKKLDGCVTVCMLSAAMDYADFSHFEYANANDQYLFQRWIQQGKVALHPVYVVFRKKG